MGTAKKSLYILPNIFTLASIFSGFLAINLSFQGELYRAALLIGLSMIFDAMDGRVARLTHTQSAFGVQLDSLADVIAFGVVPGVVIYQWTLSGLGFVGAFGAFSLMAFGAMRLARFNVQAAEDHGVSKYFTGLPIPAAAGVVASLILVSLDFKIEHPNPALQWLAFGLSILLSLLMVSTIQYPTFKKMKMNNKTRSGIVMAVASIAVVSVMWSFFLAVHLSLLTYIAYGLIRSAVMMTRKIRTSPNNLH